MRTKEISSNSFLESCSSWWQREEAGEVNHRGPKMIMPDKHFYLKIFILWIPTYIFLFYDMTCGFILSL